MRVRSACWARATRSCCSASARCARSRSDASSWRRARTNMPQPIAAAASVAENSTAARYDRSESDSTPCRSSVGSQNATAAATATAARRHTATLNTATKPAICTIADRKLNGTISRATASGHRRRHHNASVADHADHRLEHDLVSRRIGLDDDGGEEGEPDRQRHGDDDQGRPAAPDRAAT